MLLCLLMLFHDAFAELFSLSSFLIIFFFSFAFIYYADIYIFAAYVLMFISPAALR